MFFPPTATSITLSSGSFNETLAKDPSKKITLFGFVYLFWSWDGAQIRSNLSFLKVGVNIATVLQLFFWDFLISNIYE